MLDQQTAIKFIYDHAETIGGDKTRITIGGESGKVKKSFFLTDFFNTKFEIRILNLE